MGVGDWGIGRGHVLKGKRSAFWFCSGFKVKNGVQQSTMVEQEQLIIGFVVDT